MSIKFIQTKATSLTYGISDVSTTIQLKNLLKLDGTSMSASDVGDILYGTFGPGTSREEIFSITSANVTVESDGKISITSVVRGLKEVSPYDTGGYACDHPAGEMVVFGNNPQVYENLLSNAGDETITGIKTFVSSPIVPTPTTDYQAATKKFVSDTITGFTGTATESTAGTTKLSTAPATPGTPIAVGDNDNRVSPVSLASVTADRVAALEGTGTPNGTTGKYVTNDDTAETGASKVLRLTSGGKVTTSTIDTGTTAGKIVVLDGSAKLPAVDGSQLTNSTVGGATLANLPNTYPTYTGGYYTYQASINFYHDGTSYRVAGWQGGAGGATTDTGAGGYAKLFNSSPSTWSIYSKLPNFSDAVDGLKFSSIGSKTISIKTRLIFNVDSGTTNTVSAWGLAGEVGAIYGAYNSTAKDTARFVYDDSSNKLYSVTSDNGVGYTANEITGITVSNANIYQIDITSTNVNFYVNGVLKFTHTTNLPNGSGDYSYLAVGSTSDGGTPTIMISPITITMPLTAS